MRFMIPSALVLMLLLSGRPAAGAGPLRIEFTDGGYVTISAANVSLRQVLNEWARLGHTRIVNVEKLGAALLTLELSHVPEKQALEIILRSVPGYLVAQRAEAVAGSSQFDRIVVMPGTVAPPTHAAAGAPPQPPPQPMPPQFAPAAVEDQDQPVQEVPEQGTADQDEQPHPIPQTLPQPGIQPMPPNPQQGQTDPNGPPPRHGPVGVPGTGTVVSPTPGQLPVPPKPPDQ